MFLKISSYETDMEPLKLYKKRISDDELVEIGYQTPQGWKIHKIEPTPSFMADYLEERGLLEVSSYYPGTYTGDRGNVPIITSNFPQEIHINESEVVGFFISHDYYYYYDDFAHPSCIKVYE